MCRRHGPSARMLSERRSETEWPMVMGGQSSVHSLSSLRPTRPLTGASDALVLQCLVSIYALAPAELLENQAGPSLEDEADNSLGGVRIFL